jgi:hypothetical protein
MAPFLVVRWDGIMVAQKAALKGVKTAAHWVQFGDFE